jgi:hypothetical protein
VLKPADDAERASWISDVLSDVTVDGLVIPEPVRDVRGRWVVDGWTAPRWVDAEDRRAHANGGAVGAPTASDVTALRNLLDGANVCSV